MFHSVERKEDLTEPIILMSMCKPKKAVQESDESYNRYILHERESHSRRSSVRINIEVYARKASGELGYHRLRNKAIVLSLPSGEQSELAIETIRQVCQAMHGKHLCKRE